MIKSKTFWAGAILLSAIPFIMMDVPKHYVDWTREVHDEMIDVVQGTYSLNRVQKATILDNILSSNKNLMFLMYIKSFSSVILLFTSIYLLRRYQIQSRASIWKASALTIGLLACTIGLKMFLWLNFNGDAKIQLLQLTGADTTIKNIYDNHFKGKVLYVDFWGTTCIPCLEEFRNFTKPIKAQYHNRKDIAYLYVCGGEKLIWKQQLKQYEIEGSHIFLNSEPYNKLYKQAILGSANEQIFMPRYLIINKQGRVVNTNAPRPSDTNSLTLQLNKYLLANTNK